MDLKWLLYIILCLFGGYVAVRVWSSAIFKSFFEAKQQHKENEHGKKEV